MTSFEKFDLPVKARASYLDILDLRDDATVLEILCLDMTSKEQFTLLFDNYIAYRKYQHRLTLRSIEETGSWPDPNWFFYKSYESEFIRWIHDESCNAYPNEKYLHFCLLTVDYVVDIVSFSDPKVLNINSA